MKVLGIDIGGSAIKWAMVNLRESKLAEKSRQVDTKDPKNKLSIAHQLTEILKIYPQYSGPIGCTLPSVIYGNIVRTAANLDRQWIGTDLLSFAKDHLQRHVAFINDCDAACLAESKGNLKDIFSNNSCLFITLGTGIGSSLMKNGVLFPNTELGHLFLNDGREVEKIASAKVKSAENLDWNAWKKNLDRVLQEYERLLWPESIIIGGAITREWEKFAEFPDLKAKVYPASMGNDAGIIGAAMRAISQ